MTDVSVRAATARSPTVPGTVAFTVIAELPETPPLVAVMAVVPTEIPVSRPVPLTVATAELLDVHQTVRPVRTFPLASLSVAANCCFAPTS